MKILELNLVNPTNGNEYCAFEKYLEDDASVFFHMTNAVNMGSIVEKGFMSSQQLNATGLGSVSYAKKNSSCFAHLGNSSDKDLVIFAVRFDLSEIGNANTKEDASTLLVFSNDLQPEILGYVALPYGYELK